MKMDAVQHPGGSTGIIECLGRSVHKSGNKAGDVSIGFAAGERLRLSYLLICTFNPYDLLPCTVGLSRWEGIFCLWFLEMVCLVVGCLETQSTHSHLSESDEVNFSH